MVQLLRLEGNADTNSKEIRCNFVENINVDQNSKISLHSVHASLKNTGQTETFIIDPSCTYVYGPSNMPPGNQIQVPVTAGTYDGHGELIEMLNLVANSVGNATDPYNGVHNVWDMDGNYSRLSVYKATPDEPGFDTGNWIWENIDATISLGSDYVTASGASDDFTGYYTQVVPLTKNNFKAKIANVDQISIDAVPFDDPTELLWGVQIDASDNYEMYVDSSVVFTSAYTAATDDVVNLSKNGNEITLKVTDSGGTDQIDETFPIQSVGYSVFYKVDIPTGTHVSITDCKTTVIEGLSPALSANVPVTFSLKFSDDAPSRHLQDLLGFTVSDNRRSGSPAQFRSNNTVRGTQQNPGILVVVDGLDLKSYVGVQSGLPDNVNFVDVVYPDAENPNEIAYTANREIKLDMKYSAPSAIRNLNVRLERHGRATHRPEVLEFIGSPVVVFEIH